MIKVKVPDKHKHRVRKFVVGVGLTAVIVSAAHLIHDHPFPESPASLPHSVRPAPDSQSPIATAQGQG